MGVFGMFRGKGWEQLTKSERGWIREYGSLSRLAKDGGGYCCTPNAVRYLLDLNPPAEQVFEALFELSKSSYTEPCALIHEYCLNQPSPFMAAWKPEHTKVYLASLSQKNWDNGWAFYEKLPAEAKSDRVNVLSGVVRNESSFCILDFLQNRNSIEDTDLLRTALEVAGQLREVSSFRDVVSVVNRRPDAHELLQSTLADLVKNKNHEHVDALLELSPGLDVNADGGALIRTAALSRHVYTLKALVSHGAHLQDHAAVLREEVSRGWGVSDDMARYLADFLKRQEAPQEEAAAQQKAPAAPADDAGYSLSGTDTLVQVRPLLPRGTLTTLFNFTLHQQTAVVDTGAAVTMTTVPFSAIEGGLDAVAEKFVALGGDAQLADAAALVIKKQRLTPSGGK